MYDVFKLFATDEVKEEEGVKLKLGENASITVARAGNDKYLDMLLSESEKYTAEINSLPSKESKILDQRILCEVLAETVLLDFEGMSFDGKPIKYSKKNAVKLLMLKDFRKLVVEKASDIDNFRIEKEAEEVKK